MSATDHHPETEAEHRSGYDFRLGKWIWLRGSGKPGSIIALAMLLLCAVFMSSNFGTLTSGFERIASHLNIPWGSTSASLPARQQTQ